MVNKIQNQVFNNFLMLLNFLFISFMAPLISDSFTHLLKDTHNQDIKLGSLIILISLLETFAFFTKLQYVKKRLQKEKIKQRENNYLFFLWIGHFSVSLATFFLIGRAFHIDIINSKSWIYALLIMLIAIKEIAILWQLIDLKEITKSSHIKTPKLAEGIADIILMLFLWIVYTLYRNSLLLGNNNLSRDNTTEFIFNLLLISILFLLIYFPVRIPYIIEKRAHIRNQTDEVFFWLPVFFFLVGNVMSLTNFLQR